jgi:hypothetical protein
MRCRVARRKKNESSTVSATRHSAVQSASRGALAPRTGAKGEGETKPEPASTFKACDADRQKLIEESAANAKTMAEIAAAALQREYPLTKTVRALKANFGGVNSTQQKRIVEVYEHVQANLGSKSFECVDKCKKVRKKALCAQGDISGNRIIICPDFGTKGCPPDFTMLHEAVHNAGVKNDVDEGGGYPPADAEDNAYSYEYFVRDLLAKEAEVKLPPKKDVPIPVP